LSDALQALHALLERRARELSDEVAHYPTPIARCDEQLPKLIEQRGEALARLRVVTAVTASSQPARLEDVQRILATYGSVEDGEEGTLVARLRAMVS
jgi:ribosomal protein L29